MNHLDLIKKKLLYRSNYRGKKEMDILLNKFVKKIINNLSEQELLDLEIFLNLEDEIIYDFYFNKIKNDKIIETQITKLFKDFKV